MKKSCMKLIAGLFPVILISTNLLAQTGLTLPPSGENQKASVTQYIGMVKITIDYNSPDVTGPTGEDRTGKIWGELVPFGLTNLGFGNGNPAPWRAGANENTVFTISHDVKIEGSLLPAGSYGLHMIPGENEWVIIFSKNYTSWGSFFYDETEDALRVKVKPVKNEFREWLTYEFIDRKPASAVASLQWENLKIPFSISVDNIVDLYVDNIRHELRSTPGFSWQGYNTAAVYCLQNNVNLDEALVWADRAISMLFIGEENFSTLQTKAMLLSRMEKSAESKEIMKRALDLPAATPIQIHGYGRQLISQGKPEEALEVFLFNARRFPDTWPVNVGLARGYSAVGKYDKALEYARLALKNAPDDGNRTNLETVIKLLEQGKDIN